MGNVNPGDDLVSRDRWALCNVVWCVGFVAVTWLSSWEDAKQQAAIEALQAQVDQLKACPGETGETTDP